MILAAALALFVEHGVDGVSIEQIAMRAGVTRATVYRRYAREWVPANLFGAGIGRLSVDDLRMGVVAQWIIAYDADAPFL